MNTSQNSTSAAVELGQHIRAARKLTRLSIAQLAEAIGRPREWLNRVELGYSDDGLIKPPSDADLKAIVGQLDGHLELPLEALLELRGQAERDYMAFKPNPRSSRKNVGKLTQVEVIVGEGQINQAIVELIREQHSDAIIRNTGIKTANSYLQPSDQWLPYREALGEFLANNPNALFKRVEFVASQGQLDLAKQADARLAGGRPFDEVINAKVRFQLDNPLMLHAFIGQREAVLALPPTSGRGGSNIALLIRDKLFVEALRTWYDEVLWENGGESRTVKFSSFDESFAEIKRMYGYTD